ncbi:MAG: nucleotide sugar dehydrogenase [Acidobacteriota bacterium]
MNAHAAELRRKIESHAAKVGIIGMGYVGLPLAVRFVEQGFTVIGFDVDAGKTERLARGECYIRHLGPERVSAMAASGRFTASADFGRLAEPDVVLICVPTPLTPQRNPDLSYVEASGRQIAACLHAGQLVVLESTTYPGTTDELLRGILESRGLRAGGDFFLAYSPEREDPGRKDFTTETTPKVVGGIDPVSGDLAQLLYDQVVDRTVRVTTARIAEATKLTENIFRAVNIALANELKMVYDRMGIDVWEVLDAAATKPFGFMRFNPGPGWGGHCIPLDPFYLSWKAREHGEAPKFIELAGDVNLQMPRWVVDKLQRALNDRGKPLRGSRILVLGIAYKKDIDDPRESPAFEIIEILLRLGADVAYHDPHIAVAPRMRTWPELPPLSSRPLTTEELRSSVAVLIVTDHSAVDYDLVAQHAPLVVDTRGIMRGRGGNVISA